MRDKTLHYTNLIDIHTKLGSKGGRNNCCKNPGIIVLKREGEGGEIMGIIVIKKARTNINNCYQNPEVNVIGIIP